jgi:hypothetical protein
VEVEVCEVVARCGGRDDRMNEREGYGGGVVIEAAGWWRKDDRESFTATW